VKFLLALGTFAFVFTLVHGVLNQPQPALATTKAPANPNTNRGTLT
jgi:hypothetical protein